MLLPNDIIILSIFKIILFECDYRTVNVFTNTNNNSDYDDVTLEMMNILKNHSTPAHILNFDEKLSNRKSCEEPILNILFAVDNAIELVDRMKHNIYPNDVSLIVDFTVQNAQIDFNIQDSIRVSNKMLIIDNVSILALNPYRHNDMEIMPLNPFHSGKALTFIQSYVHPQKYVRQWNVELTIFFQFLSPRSMILILDSDYIYAGVDGSMAAILLNILNATGTFVSDVGLMYPVMVSSWNETQILSTETYGYYKNALTNNRITDYYQR